MLPEFVLEDPVVFEGPESVEEPDFDVLDEPD